MHYSAVNMTSQQYLGLNLLQLFLFVPSSAIIKYHTESISLPSTVTSLRITPATTQEENGAEMVSDY